MRLSNPEAYPVTSAFEKFLIQNKIAEVFKEDIEILNTYQELNPGKVAIGITANAMLESLGEYEHGLRPELLEMYNTQVDILFGEPEDNEEASPNTQEYQENEALKILRLTYEDLLLTMINRD